MRQIKRIFVHCTAGSQRQTIDDLKAHGIRVVDDLNNEIFDEIGDAI